MVGISIDPRYKADKTRFLCKNLRGPPNGLVSREASCRGNRSFSGLGRVFVAPCLGCVESVDAECHYVLQISLIGIGELSIYSSWRGFHAFIFVSGVSVYLFFFLVRLGKVKWTKCNYSDCFAHVILFRLISKMRFLVLICSSGVGFRWLRFCDV